MLTPRRRSSRRTATAIATTLVTALCVGVLTAGTASAALAPKPSLKLDRTITTSPFAGSSTSAKDNEGMAYVPRDGSIWIADDDSRSLYEINATTGALKRTINGSTLSATPRLGGGGTAGPDRTRDLESLAYDQTNDVLYAFSGSCCAVGVLPTAYRLRRVSGKLQPDAFQPLPGSDFTAAAWNPADRKVYVGINSTFQSYDFASNRAGAPFSVSGVKGILGMDFTDDGKDMLVARDGTTVNRVAWSSRSLVSGWTLNLSSFGMLDTRAVEIVGDRMFVSDGYDLRAPGDPRAHAIFVFSGIGSGTPSPSPSPSRSPSPAPSPSPPPAPSAPVASFTATPTSGAAPHSVAFQDTSTGSQITRSWKFGDGATSSTRAPSHVYSSPGSYTVRLTVTNSAGSSTATRTITVSGSG